MKSLKFKAITTLCTMMIFSFIIGLLLCFAFSTSYFVKEKLSDMLDVYNSMLYFYSSDIPDADNPNSEIGHMADAQNLILICEEKNVSALIMASSGVVDFSYGNQETLIQRMMQLVFNRDTDTSQIVSQTDKYTVQTTYNDDYSVTHLEMWGFLDNGYMFVIRSSSSGIQSTIDSSLSFFAFVCICIFVIVLIGFYFIIRSYTEPLKSLVSMAQRVNENDFETPYDSSKRKRKDEIGVLGENIVTIAHRLEQTIAELKTANLSLQNELRTKEKLEEARKKYMSDVSHELKTPIALISGYAEGIKENIGTTAEDRDYYCDVIIDEAEKMNLMLKRLSILNQLEEGSSELEMEHFDVVDAINGFLNTMSIILDERYINLYFDVNSVIYVWTDEFMFEQVLINYINNAINHVDEHREIRITVEPVSGNARVTVYNSGEHIRDDELEKIWDKFYKVDKARTREYGGSGLGLSIVKAISEVLGKECGVYNTDGGVAFWIDLELDRIEEKPPVEQKKKIYTKKNDGSLIKNKLTQMSRKKDKNNTKTAEKKKIRKTVKQPKKEKDASDKQ